MSCHNPCAQTNALVLTGLLIKANVFHIQGMGSLCPYPRAHQLSRSIFIGTVSVPAHSSILRGNCLFG